MSRRWRLVAPAHVAIGFGGGAVYWAAAQIWPASVAVVLSLLAMHAMEARTQGRAIPGAPFWVFAVLVKYNALIALSSARGPLSLPADLTVGLIMVAGQGAAGALCVSTAAMQPSEPGRPDSTDAILALCAGLAPATLLGLPGLVGLAAAIGLGLLLTTAVPRRSGLDPRSALIVVQQVVECGFYLGALGSWKFA